MEMRRLRGGERAVGGAGGGEVEAGRGVLASWWEGGASGVGVGRHHDEGGGEREVRGGM